MKLLKFATLAGAALLALTTGQAHAAFVTQWQVDVDANFVQSSIQPGAGISFNNSKSLSWGTPATNTGNSGLDISTAPITTINNTNGAAQANVTITHRNNPITGTTLAAVDILASLTLTALTPSGPIDGPTNITFGVKFLETPNAGTGGFCADGKAVNSGGINANGCSDIFVIDQNSLNFPFLYDTDGLGGDAPELYYISFFESTSGLNPLSAAACLAVTGSSAPCLGFQTSEQATTAVRFAALITGDPVVINVPEPGSLALAGLALTGLAGAGRRRKIAQA